MDRRELLGVLEATTAGFVTVVGGAARAEREGHKDDPHRKCAEVRADCMRACEIGFHHCFGQLTSGKVEHAMAPRLCVDCVEILEQS